MRTLRVQLMAVLILVGVAIIGIITWVTFVSHRSSAIEQAYNNLEKQSKEIVNMLGDSNSDTSQKLLSEKDTLQYIAYLKKAYGMSSYVIKGNECIFQNEIENSTEFGNDAIPVSRILSQKERKALQQAKKDNHFVKVTTNKKLFFVQPISSKQNADRYIAVSVDEEAVLAGTHKAQRNIYIVDAILFLAIILIAVFYSLSVIKPLKELTTSIKKITDGFLGEKLTVDSYTEVEDVVDSINSMTTKLETLESSRQEFVSNVSHELKTPITSIKVLADSLLQQEDAPAELYREFLIDINAEIERENKIITDLLSLVKMDKTSGVLNITTINISELCEQILKRIKPIAAERNIELIFESYRAIMAEVDEVKLSLAINNLIENAVKYNYDNGWVRVSLNADHKFFYIKVADSGVGIPEDEQDNVFERFYRVDKARSRETGGTGLGLSITRNAILMHRGAIKIYSKEKEGTTFTVRIPLNYVS